MFVTCLFSNTNSDVRCPICGQGFLLFVERTTATVRHQLYRRAEKTMRLHHDDNKGHLHVHPLHPFHLKGDDTMLGNIFSSLSCGKLIPASC